MEKILGTPAQGFHTHTFLGSFVGFAIFDVISTLIGGYLVHAFFGYSLLKSILVLFAVGELAHLAFGVDTVFIHYGKKLYSKL